MPTINHEPICRERIRLLRGGFGWVDHRLVRDRYIDRCSPTALALYLFLVAVANADGVSYWGDKTIAKRLHLGIAELRAARDQLLAAELIAYEQPLWQLLQLPNPPQVNP